MVSVMKGSLLDVLPGLLRCTLEDLDSRVEVLSKLMDFSDNLLLEHKKTLHITFPATCARQRH